MKRIFLILIVILFSFSYTHENNISWTRSKKLAESEISNKTKVLPKIENNLSAPEIIKRTNDIMQGNSSRLDMTLSIVRPKYTRSISLKCWALEKKYFMAYVISPIKEKGQVVMKYNNEIWQYTPSINRTIKLPISMMSQGFMGSDYSNDDLVHESSIVKDYNPTLTDSEKIDNRDCYKINMKPKPESNIVWGKVILWVDKKYFIILKAEYYDEENYLVRTMYGKEIKYFSDRFLTSVMETIPSEEPNNKTVVTIKKAQFNIGIKKEIFSLQNMKRIR